MAHALRLSLATAAFLFLFGIIMQAAPADLEKPATLDQIIAMAPSPAGLNACYIEASAAGNFLTVGERKATGGVGAGCDWPLMKAISAGLGLRANFGEIQSGSAQLRVGLDVNPSLKLYPFLEWNWSDWQAWDVGQLYVGGGAETSLGTSPVSVFVEGSTAVSKAGPGVTRDDVVIRLGGRIRLGK
ncbi:MAG: hypothetical protein AB7O43_18365 [Hyphomicrobiaceae bacterium]